nr:immunoglobulin heavy chain junction region [Macaca mulatta]
CAKKKDSLDVW